jgi:very-short-patch-repair endonuclease
MQVKLLNGEVVNINLKKYKFDHNKKSKSKFQREIALQLKEDFPHDIIFEEVRIPKENLILDFFIPSVKIVVECQGRQHKEHIKFFHGKIKDFHNQQERDNRKREWCIINGFKLIEINSNESR